MPGKSARSRVKSVRFPLEVWDEVSHTARGHGVTFQEEVMERIRAGADPSWAPEQAEGQTSIDDFLEEGR